MDGGILCGGSILSVGRSHRKAAKHVSIQLLDAPDPLRIAVLAHLHHPIRAPFAGGMEAHTAHLVSDLSSRGHRVTLFAKAGSEALSPRATLRIHPVISGTFEVRGYPDDHLKNAQHRKLDGAMKSAVEHVRAGDFDVVINNSLSPIPHAHLQGVAVLHILHTPPLPRITSLLDKQKTDERHRFATVSAVNARAWRRWLPQLEIIPNGINMEFWGNQPHAEVSAGTAAWTGRITPEKGTHLAIAAARANNLRLAMAGPIQDREYFNELIAPSLAEDARYLGHLPQEELRQLIGSSEVFISSPLWEEPFGLTTLEAMACGTPVAALPAGAMAELIGTTGGALATARTAAALGHAVARALAMDRQKVRERAAGFSRELMIEAYESLLAQIAAPLALRGRES